LSVADNIGFGDKKQTNFYNVSYFRNGDVDKIANMFTKGKSVHIVGEFQARPYKDQNGNDKLSIDIRANNVSFAGSSGGNNGSGGNNNDGGQTTNSAPTQQQESAPAQQSAPATPPADDDGF
jgi:single-strand DNA-binding protein